MFKVINGDPENTTLAPEAARKKLNKLRLMELHVYQARRTTSSPRIGPALLVGSVLAASLFDLIYLAESAGLWPDPRVPAVLQHITSTVLPFVAGVAAWAYVMRNSSLPVSWADLLNRDLSDYSPIDREAYRSLQKKTEAVGFIDYQAVCEYIINERRAVLSSVGQSSYSFTRKKI